MKFNFIALVGLIYIYLAYNYITNLKSCSCVKGQYVENVKTSEGFIMSIILLWIFVKLLNRKNPIFSNFLSIILFLTYIYFCYYVYQMKVTAICNCDSTWQKWLVDIQYGVLLVEILLVFLSSL